MDTDQTTEYASAFTVGLLLGVGAALLFAPKPPTRKERIMKQIKPYRKKLEKRASSAKKQVGGAVSSRASAAADWRDEMIEASRAVIADMRSEVAKMVADARGEIADAVADQLDNAQKSLKKSAKKIRS